MPDKNQKLNYSLPQRVYFIWNYLEWGGAQVHFLGLMKEVRKFCDAKFIMPAGSHRQLLTFLDNAKASYDFFNAHSDIKPAFTLKRKLERHWNKIYCELVLLRYLKKVKLKNSLIHADFAPWESMTLILWLCAKARVFVTIHNSLPKVAKWRYLLWKVKFRILTMSPNFNIFTSNINAKESLKPFVSDDFFDKITVTFTNVNPVEIEKSLTLTVKRSEICKKYNLPAEKFLIFCVGQFIDRKGRWIFLEAANALVKENNDIHFVWVSTSEPDSDDLKKIESYNLDGFFTLINSEQIGSEHIDLFKLLRIADLFTLPSFTEGLPISLLEAMALGIPCISTNINAIPEALHHLETGWLIEPGDAEGLAEAIETLKSNKILSKELSENGQAYVLENFNELAVAKIVLNKYIESFGDCK